MVGRSVVLLLAAAVCATSTAEAQRRLVVDREPNNTPAMATPVWIGDTLAGSLSSIQDVDYYTIDVPAGTVLTVTSTDWLLFHVFFFDTDGRTITGGFGGDTPYSDDPDRAFALTAAGRYYIEVLPRNNHEWTTPPNHPYGLAFDSRPLTLGPGDPVSTFFSDSGIWYGPYTLAAGRAGDLFVNSPSGLGRIDADGQFTRLANGPRQCQIVVDGFGNLLLPADPYSVVRLGPTGMRTLFSSGRIVGTAITIGPDGDVWVAGAAFAGSTRLWIWRLDPFGVVKDSVELEPHDAVSSMAFSPSGVLHFASLTGVQAIVGHRPQLVIPNAAARVFRELAFDEDGNIYVSVPESYADTDFPRVDRYSRDYLLQHAPFATITTLGSLTFARDAVGRMTHKLLVGQVSFPARIAELNSSGIENPGFQIGTDFLQVTQSGDSAVSLGAGFSAAFRLDSAPSSVNWSVVTGKLPPGLTLNPTTGVLAGAPSDTGQFTFTIQAKSAGRLGYIRPTISVANVPLTVDALVDALLNTRPLNPALAEFLDRHGNHNGQFDVGDLRAYLRSQHHLP